MLGYKSILNPCVCILGLDDLSQSSVKHKCILRICWYAARLCIFQRWVEDTPPDVSLWYEKCINLIPLERLSYITKNRLGQFLHIWKPVITNIEN